MARLPVVDGDEDNWGSILREFLLVEHDTDGTLKRLNQASGICPLDSNSLVPSTNLGLKGGYSAIVYIDGSSIIARDYKGDLISSGTAGTDDANVIQTAWNEGGKIIIKKATYKIGTTLNPISNSHISIEKGTIFQATTGVDIIKVDTKQNVVIEHLEIDGASTGLSGILVHESTRCIFVDIYGHDFKEHGFYATSMKHGLLLHCRMENLGLDESKGQGFGLATSTSEPCEYNTMIDCYVKNPFEYGLSMWSTDPDNIVNRYNTIIGLIVEIPDKGDGGLWANAAQKNTFVGMIVHGRWDLTNMTTCVALTSNSGKNDFYGCKLYDGSYRCFHDAGTAGLANRVIGGEFSASEVRVTRGNTKFIEVMGYVTENEGSATIANGGTSVTVNHGLVDTPSNIQVTGTHSEVKDAYATNPGSTSFDIKVDSAVSADRTVYWKAKI